MEYNKEIMDELVVPERQGILSSTRYSTMGEKIIQETGIGFCDNCKYLLDKNKPIIICNYNDCNKKLCTSHSCYFEYRRNFYCKEHIQELLPLSVHEFEVLHCINLNLNPNKLKELAGISKEEYQTAFNGTLQKNYIIKKGISVFATLEVTGKGILAWKTYFESFKQDGDVEHFIDKVTSELNDSDR